MRGVPFDLINAFRRLARRPRFAVLLTLTIALGIGSATAIFSLVDGVLWKPLPYPDAGRMVWIARTSEEYRANPSLAAYWDKLPHAFPVYQAWAAEQSSFTTVGGWARARQVLRAGEIRDLVYTGRATSSLREVMGIRPALGRWFAPGEDGAAAHRVAVLSYETWTARFGADRSILGRTIALDDESWEVIGVLPPGFRTIGEVNRAEVWTPAGSAPSDQRANTASWSAVGVLPAGRDLASAQAETERLLGVADNQGRAGGVRLAPAQREAIGGVRAPLTLLLWAAGLLLIIACGNVATLLLGELSGRQGELATRVALGAGRLRVARQLLLENLALALLGAGVGLALAAGGVRVLRSLAPPGIPRIEAAQVDLRGVSFAVAATLATTLLFSLAPLLSIWRLAPHAVLQTGSGRIAGGPARLQRWGVAVQSALVVVLLAGAALLVRTSRELNAVELGFRADDVLSVSLRLPFTEPYTDVEARRAIFGRVVERLRALPEVTSAAAGKGVPFQGGISLDIRIGGSAVVNEETDVRATMLAGEPGFLETLGIPLRAGRLFGEADTGPGDAVLVGETLARRFWPEGEARGRRILVGEQWRTVVGVVGDVRHARLDEEERPAFYLPASQTDQWLDMVVLRAAGDPLALIPAVRSIVAEVEPVAAIEAIDRLRNAVDRTLVTQRFRMWLIALFAAAATLMAAIGVYGVANGYVLRRARELAIRSALGATPRRVLRLVLRSMLFAAAGGAAAGAVLALFASRVVQPYLFGVTTRDAASHAAAVLLVVLSALAAAWIPARRATRLDLMETLRNE